MKPFTVALLCGFIFLCGQANAQPKYQQVIDSLLNIINTLPEDTNKVKMYGDLSFNYAGTRTALDLAHAYADSTRLLSEKMGYEQGIIQSHMYYGFCDRYKGNYADALTHFQIFTDYYKKTGDELMEARGWFQIATVQQDLGNYEQSLAACEYALQINEKNEQWNGVVATLNTIGIIYKRTGKYEQAIACYQKAIAVNDSFNLNRDLTYILMNTGNSYGELKEYEKALNYYQQSLKVSYAANNEYGIASNLANSGSVYNQMKQYDKALDFHLQALRIWEKSPNKTKLATSLLETGQTYVKLNRFSLAKKHLEEGLALAQELNAKGLMQDGYRDFTELYANANDYKQAYEFEKLFHAMKDSIFSENNVKQINELQTKFETAEKDKQIVVLAGEKEIQAKEIQRQTTLKRSFIGGLIAVVLLAGLVVLIFRQRLKNQKLLTAKNEEVKEVNFKRQLSELEMKALRAQINPHFLFNCMNSINRMILNDESENASRYLTKFSKLVRSILENSEAPTVSLENELAMLESYIQLEALRFKGKINYQIVLDESIEPEDTYLPSMVLQPFVENAIWHGLMHKETEDKGMITIAIREDEDRLLCTIEDNGVGREKAQILREKSVLKSKSMGMKITEERLRLLSKEQMEQLVRITDLKDAMDFARGTRVEINIPIS